MRFILPLLQLTILISANPLPPDFPTIDPTFDLTETPINNDCASNHASANDLPDNIFQKRKYTKACPNDAGGARGMSPIFESAPPLRFPMSHFTRLRQDSPCVKAKLPPVHVTCGGDLVGLSGQLWVYVLNCVPGKFLRWISICASICHMRW